MTRSAPSSPPAPLFPEPAASSPARKPGVRALVRAVGGPRYVVALAIDSIGAGLLRPFLLLYGIDVLHLAALTAGLAMTAGVVAGLGCMPVVGRWLDRGARSAVVAASMLVRVIGTVLLLAAPLGHAATVWMFAVAALFLGSGGQGVSASHAALVSTISAGRQRDAALAAGRSVRNAGLGLGALVAIASLTGGTAGLRAVAAGTAVSYLLAAALASSVRIRAGTPPAGAHDSTTRDTGPAPRARRTAVPPMRLLLAANVSYAFCLSIPEVALPLVLVTQLHASPAWAAVVFVINTGLVVAFQVPVTVWMSRFSRRTALTISGVVISVSYLGFLGSVELPHRWAVPAIVGVSVLSTLGELIYAGSSTALVAAAAPEHVLGRALARFQLSTGFTLAISPAIITALAARGPAALWLSLTAATLLAAAAVARPSAVEARGPVTRQGSRSAVPPQKSCTHRRLTMNGPLPGVPGGAVRGSVIAGICPVVAGAPLRPGPGDGCGCGASSLLAAPRSILEQGAQRPPAVARALIGRGRCSRRGRHPRGHRTR
jgi:MFS family permease